MYFKASKLARFLAPLLHMGGMPPVFCATDVPVTVQIASQPDSASLTFQRVFETKKPKVFNTQYDRVGGSRLIDWTKGDTGWLMDVKAEGHTITMRHGGYRGRLFGKVFALPLEWLIGETTASETALDDNRFAMQMEIRRSNGALFYAYGGEFEISGVIRRD